METEQIYLLVLAGIPVALFVYALLTHLQTSNQRMQALHESMSDYDLARSKSIWGQTIPITNIILQCHNIIPAFGNFTRRQGKKMEPMLLQAGRPGNISGEQLLAFKELCALMVFIIVFVLLQVKNPLAIIGGPLLAYFLPDLKLRDIIQRTKSNIVKELPDALDTLGLMVSASQGFNQAIAIYLKQSFSKSVDSPDGKALHHANQSNSLADQLLIYQREMALGMSSNEALKSMSDRLQCGPLTDFVLSTIQAQRTGTPLSKTLEEQATALREKRFQQADMAGQKAVVKLLFPLMFFILPCCFLILFGPLLVNYINK